MEIELSPELPEEVAAAVVEAVAQALAAHGDPGAWWRAGVQENLEPDSP